MRHFAMVAALAMIVGVSCKGLVEGKGTVYVYNGTDAAATVKLEGSSPMQVELRPQSGQLLTGCVAGSYQISVARKGGFPEIMAAAIVRDRLTIINVGAAACFARADIVGMYGRSKPPVRVTEVYRGKAIISIPEEISVLPGEPVPQNRPRNTEIFFRVDVFPCAMADLNWKIEEYLHKHK